MLIEIRVKVTRTVDETTGKTKTVLETYIINKEFYAQAEFKVNELLTEQNVEEYHITSMRHSAIREMASQFTGEHSFIATLRDTFITDSGVEKHLRYKVLLWADNLTQANHNTQELANQGYNMLIEGIKQVDYIYINEPEEEEENHE